MSCDNGIPFKFLEIDINVKKWTDNNRQRQFIYKNPISQFETNLYVKSTPSKTVGVAYLFQKVSKATIKIQLAHNRGHIQIILANKYQRRI